MFGGFSPNMGLLTIPGAIYNRIMATTAAPIQIAIPTRTATPIPWYLWSLVLAVSLVTLGGQVDVSWHRSIGRDTFWTPPHMMVYACGLIAGVICAWFILATTFGNRPDLRATSVSLFGLRAPLGIFVTAWGGLMMLYSAPVDNWWHNAYGLDVRVASPPHILLLSGTAAVGLGTLLLAAAHMNRRLSAPSQSVSSIEVGSTNLTHYQNLFLFVGALAVIHLMSYSMGYTFDTRLHQSKPYLVMSTGVPFALGALATAARRRWTATLIATVYTVFMLALVWGLPLIPASPRIGPVYQQVTQMIPPKFPILLIVPALALDILWQRLPNLNRWLSAVLSGLAWLTLLVAVEWPFATFLMSPYAANRFFATRFLDFGTPSGNPDALRIFEAPQQGPHLYAGLLLAAVVAIIAIRLGELFGQWMRQIYR
jgi:hypothetical protein